MVVYNGTGRLRKVLLSSPKYLFEAAPINEISKKHQDGLNNAKMMAEFQDLVQTYQDNGVEVVTVDAHEGVPEAIFARDFGGNIREGYILGKFVSDVRFEERNFYENIMKQLGIKKIAQVQEGHFEGGDFAFIDEHTLAIGMIQRTDEKGVAEIRQALEPLGYQVYGVPANPDYLHLDMCFNLVAPQLAIGYRDGLTEDFLNLLAQKGIELISGDEAMIYRHAYNVQALGNNRVLSLCQNTFINNQLRQHGMTVIEVDITEILKAGGGIHCMTFPLERDKK
ncbi:dimethylarginine dimethylaminohydrolase family protein [Streptococcus dentiloxodontae]